MTSHVGHVSLKGFRALPEHAALSRCDFVEAVKAEMFRFVAEGGFTDLVAVYEEGTENGHPHFHYFITSAKSHHTLRRLFAKYFKKGSEGQFMSLKSALSEKLDKYFLYLAKGFDAKEGSPVEVLWDTHGYVSSISWYIFVLFFPLSCLSLGVCGPSCTSSSTSMRRLLLLPEVLRGLVV